MSQAVYEGHKTYRVRGVGIAAVAMVALAALAYVAFAALVWAIRASVAAAAGLNDLDDAIALEDLTPAFSFVVAGVQIGALVLTIIWLWRARKNLDAFPDTQPVLSPGWAIGGWFLPFANAVIPGRLMANVARQSSRERWVSALAVVWWIALLAANLADQLAGVLVDNQSVATDLDSLVDHYQSVAVTQTVSAVAAVLAATAFALVVPRVSAAQEERMHRGWYEAQNRALGTPPPPVDPSPVIGG
ncbi:uncharacterized protein DUF4328 [Asanoa ferruginea]|uniref:Uncharacterized protein DUF4328 n=1 Tax=Asanoa ferruginea TaxID=53367 RepID=A0A3D9ZCY1_9ACTN|nr:DUF4328 domain-containing protein [Asanoa ferruginea]REF95117.1 uncharacterized protein DUF4328 [Asanoa ferruginea]GIF52945.1 hypothetical protein Afe04nite_74840 [Asanoa ferruginea]